MPYLTDKAYIGQTTKISLDDSNLSGSDDYNVSFTIVDESGNVIQDGSGVDLEDVVCSWDEENDQYYKDITLDSELSEGIYRIYWTVIVAATSRQVDLLDKNSPGAIKIVNQSEFQVELVNAHWFIDEFLENVPLENFKIDRIRETLRIAQKDLEKDTQVYFTSTLISNEQHDYYYEQFRRTFWMQNLFHSPIISVSEIKLKWGDQEIAVIDSDYHIVDKIEGLVRVVPTQGGYFYNLLYSGLGGLSINNLAGFGNIPAFFHFTYRAGLDWENLDADERDEIRYAIGRRAAIELLPKLDNRMGISSESKSIDGASQSTSYTSSAMYGQYSAQIEQYQKDQEMWIANFRRKYGKDLVMVIA